MVQVTYTPRFITDNFFDPPGTNPAACKIVAVAVLEREQGGNEIIAELVGNNDHVRMSIWGKNLKHLIESFGSDTEQWIGRSVRVAQTMEHGKKVRVIACLK